MTRRYITQLLFYKSERTVASLTLQDDWNRYGDHDDDPDDDEQRRLPGL